MKILVLIIPFFICSSFKTAPLEIYGFWKLEKVETKQGTFIPEKSAYLLSITKELITYNLEVNKCQSNDFVITQNQIETYSKACTKICCDGRDELISDYLDFNGSYAINQNELIITTSNAKLYLESFDPNTLIQICY